VLGRRFRDIGVEADVEHAAPNAARMEVPARHKLGHNVWLQFSCSRFRDENGLPSGFRGVCIDVTERRRDAESRRNLEVELNRVDKLGALEHVMSMLAHELNQPLTAVSSYCGASIRLLRSNPRELDEVIAALTAAVSQAKAASDAVRGIRHFVARREPDIGAQVVEKMIADALSLVEFRRTSGRVEIQTALVAGLPGVRADSILIVQVLLNLLHNAFDSLAETNEPRIIISAWTEDSKWVHVSVSDNGPGLTEDVAARGLEPYFTTKATGLGLGLSIAQTIIESHGGELSLKNNPGGGCVAQFTLQAIQTNSSGASGHGDSDDSFARLAN
jgi:C4-dicarboxylate-specific signal transduction histidine kinase